MAGMWSTGGGGLNRLFGWRTRRQRRITASYQAAMLRFFRTTISARRLILARIQLFEQRRAQRRILPGIVQRTVFAVGDKKHVFDLRAKSGNLSVVQLYPTFHERLPNPAQQPWAVPGH